MREILKALLPVYTLLLIYMMLFGMGREAGEIGNLQLTPFRSIERFSNTLVPIHDFVVNIICNIIVFMPFGWLGIYNKVFNPLYILFPIFFIFIVSIEMVQHFSGRGVADIDDVILNSVGMLSGYSLYYFIDKIKAKQQSWGGYFIEG